jgi:nucleoside-diphosphate-sugar epimerase
MIFLTGGTGLVGSHILMMLVQDNISVKALKRNSSRLDVCRKVFSYHNLDHKFKEVQWCEGDINDIISLENHMKDCDTIVHAAALVLFLQKKLPIVQ